MPCSLLTSLWAETSPLLAVGTGVGLLTVITLHVAAARREAKVDSKKLGPITDGFVNACAVSGISEKCGTVVSVNGERVAIFKYDGKISAISNVCRHQNGPLGEGRIIDGCVSCPWHGFSICLRTELLLRPSLKRFPCFKRGSLMGAFGSIPDRTGRALGSSPR